MMMHFDTTSWVNMILRWCYDRFIYVAIIELLCYQRLLHVQYISFDDLVITTTRDGHQNLKLLLIDPNQMHLKGVLLKKKKKFGF